MNLKIEYRKAKDLKFYPGNPRKISREMLEKLKKSIKEFGVVQPLVVNKKKSGYRWQPKRNGDGVCQKRLSEKK